MVSLPNLFEKSAVQALSSTQPRSNLLRAILLAGELGSILGGLKEASGTDPTVFTISKPKHSNMRELEPKTGTISKEARVNVIQDLHCTVPTQLGLECLSQHRKTPDLTPPHPILYDPLQSVSTSSKQSRQTLTLGSSRDL